MRKWEPIDEQAYRRKYIEEGERKREEKEQRGLEALGKIKVERDVAYWRRWKQR